VPIGVLSASGDGFFANATDPTFVVFLHYLNIRKTRPQEEFAMLIHSQVHIRQTHALHQFRKFLNTPVVFPALVNFRDNTDPSLANESF
jgi:hypothetical protein